MTAQEYLATIKRPMTDIERNCAIDAWDAAKKDCALDCRFRYAIGRIRAVIRDIDEENDEYEAMAQINAICDDVWRAK